MCPRPEIRPRALSILYAGSSVGALAGVPAGTWLGQQTSWQVAFLVLSGVGLLILTTLVVLMPSAPPGERETAHGSTPDAGRYWAIVVYTALAVGGTSGAALTVPELACGQMKRPFSRRL